MKMTKIEGMTNIKSMQYMVLEGLKTGTATVNFTT